MRKSKKEQLIELGWLEDDVQMDDRFDPALVGVTADTYQPIYDIRMAQHCLTPDMSMDALNDFYVVEFDSDIDRVLEENKGALIFESPSYHNAIIGSTSDGRIVYDYDKMVECLCEEDGMTNDEALDFIGYNTFRAMPYFQPSPVVYMPIDNFIEDEGFGFGEAKEVQPLSDEEMKWFDEQERKN